MLKNAIGDSSAILDSEFIALVVVQNRQIVWANRSMHEVFAYAPGELIGLTTRVFFFDDASYEHFGREVRATLAQGGVFKAEMRQKRKDGSVGWFEFNVSRLAGSEDACVAAIIDISERHRLAEDLRDSKERFELASAVGGVAVWRVSLPSGRLETDGRLEKLYGYEPGELGEQSIDWLSLVNSEDRFATAATWQALIDGETKRQYQEFRARHSDGSTRWMSVSSGAQRDAEGNVIAIVGVTRDITERRNAEEALLSSEARYRAVVQDQTEVIARLKPDGTFIFVNDTYCRTFGKQPDEVLGQRWFPVAHPEDLPMVQQRLSEMSPDNPVVLIENRVLNADGVFRWMQFVNRGFFDAEGNLLEIQSVGRDIDGLKKIESDLREREAQLEMALSASGLAVWDRDLAAGLIRTDQRITDMLGYHPAELASAEAWDGLLDPRDRERVEHHLQTHLRGDSPDVHSEHRVRHRDGHWVTIDMRAKVVLRDARGEPLRLLGTVQDVTQRRRLNEEGGELLKRIEALIRDVSSNTVETRPRHAAVDLLTKRERQILALIAGGMTSAQIAARLKVSPNTVNNHRQNLMTKLNLHNTAELTRFAIEHGLTE